MSDVGYPLIADHGVIGDLQTAALVSTSGQIDWYCCPRFDSPSVFASLLDATRGGGFQIAPEQMESVIIRQLYIPDTAILVTRYMAPTGVGEVVDFMPIAGREPTDRHRLVRVVRVIRGEMRFRLECAPRLDFARRTHQVEFGQHGAVFHGGHLSLTLHAMAPLQRHGEDAVATLSMRAGEVSGCVLESGTSGPPTPVSRGGLDRLFRDTARFWQSWLLGSTYRGRWREMVERSAITLKLLTYAPSGAPVAALTAGLPEQIGGERNWDYRYTWIRDASFTIDALGGLGFAEEAAAFAAWLRQRVEQQRGGASGPLRVMYRVDGSSDLDELTLDHLEGYRGSRPVRIGNGAASQLQLDIYGEALDAIFRAHGQGHGIAHAGWEAIRGVVDWLASNWDRPDEGIWETRGGRQDFVYGRVMSWVAFDRAIRLAGATGRPALLDRWMAARDAVYEQVFSRGRSARRRAFVQHYGAEVLDASLLVMPRVSFLVPTDPWWRATLEAIERDLVSDSLVYRYDPEASPDGLRGSEGTFSICTFWYIDALTLSGRLDEARLVFDKMLTYANHLGLYGEEIGLSGEQLGNFPQAFTHLALIRSAMLLDGHLASAKRSTTPAEPG
jgi:GH15 family glucan-1,4-alpha-glucosidase